MQICEAFRFLSAQVEQKNKTTTSTTKRQIKQQQQKQNKTKRTPKKVISGFGQVYRDFFCSVTNLSTEDFQQSCCCKSVKIKVTARGSYICFNLNLSLPSRGKKKGCMHVRCLNFKLITSYFRTVTLNTSIKIRRIIGSTT